MRIIMLGLVCSTLLGGTALWAQDRAQSLADIRMDLSRLYSEIQGLKSELTPSADGTAPAAAAGLMDRVTLIEAELQRITAKAEQLEYRIDRIVQDGTNRIGDLEFRLVELEGGDISALSETTTLGGAPDAGASGMSGAGMAAGLDNEPELAVSEEQDFARADEAFSTGDYERAASLFATFYKTYPAGPLTPVALFKQGLSYKAIGDHRAAATTFLDLYRQSAQSEVGPAALVELGGALGRLGKVDAACTTLAQAQARYSDPQLTAQISKELSALTCS